MLPAVWGQGMAWPLPRPGPMLLTALLFFPFSLSKYWDQCLFSTVIENYDHIQPHSHCSWTPEHTVSTRAYVSASATIHHSSLVDEETEAWTGERLVQSPLRQQLGPGSEVCHWQTASWFHLSTACRGSGSQWALLSTKPESTVLKRIV